MICLVALVVFSFLGIFSVKHRELAKESFQCMKDRSLRRPCESDLEDRLKASMVGRVLDYSPRTARVLNKYFKAFSWMFVIIMVVSGLLLGQGVYNLAVHGDCYGPESEEQCSLNEPTFTKYLPVGYENPDQERFTSLEDVEEVVPA